MQELHHALLAERQEAQAYRAEALEHGIQHERAREIGGCRTGVISAWSREWCPVHH